MTKVNWVLVMLLGVLPAALPLSAQAREPLLDDVLTEVRNAYNRQQRPMVIFDLDGTLFDNRNRILKILQEYGEEELKTVRPKAAKKLSTLTKEQIQYMLTDTMSVAGITEAAVVNNAAVFWSQRFFSDDYITHDEPTAGAVQYVRTLYSNGARIVYLTGRDAPRQLMGTVKALRDRGFPIGIQGTELIMKPSMQTQDAVFKQQVTTYLRHHGKVIAAFDNEPGNANVYRRMFPGAKIVLYEAPGSPNPPPLLANIVRLVTFE